MPSALYSPMKKWHLLMDTISNLSNIKENLKRWVSKVLWGWNPGSLLYGKSLKEMFLYFMQRMTRMWANYGVQMPMGRWYLLCFLAFCFSGKSRVRSHCRKLKPDTPDMKWFFLMLTVINSWNNRHGNLTDPPMLGLLIKALRTWKKKLKHCYAALPQFSL